MKLIDEILELEERTQKYKQDRMNVLTLETAINPIAYRLLINSELTRLKGPQQEHKSV